MQDSKKSGDPQRTGKAASSATPTPESYRYRNSGRRASGHGGGDLDTPEEFPEAHHETGYDYSGGGHGHESNRSLDHEIEEDLESRSDPYIRAGQPSRSNENREPSGADASKRGGNTRK